MWLPWPLRLCISRKPVVKNENADISIKADALPGQAITSPPRNQQPASESPVPSPAPREGHEQLPIRAINEETKLFVEPTSAAADTTEGETVSVQGVEESSDSISKAMRKKHRPSQLSVEDIDLMDIRSPNPALQRTPVPVTPQSASSVLLTTLEILRTPMPFGSPVPDPARITNIAQALEDGAALKAPAFNQPEYRNLPYTVPLELRHVERPPSHPDTPVLGPMRAASSKLPSRPSPLQSNSLSNKGNPFQTPSPLESDRRFAVSSQDPDSTPHVVGLSNPATAYKENKAVRLRHTPFNERVDKEVQKERLFSERLSSEKAGVGRKT